MCRTCGRLFQTAAGLGRHTQSSQTCARPVVAEEIISTRYRPTIDMKTKILAAYIQLTNEHNPCARLIILDRYPRINPSQITKWYGMRDKLYEAQRLGYGGCRNIITVSRVRYPEQENELYLRFVHRRIHLGLKTTDIWLRLMMQELLRVHKPAGWEVSYS